MKVLGISGSPRLGGNTELLVKQALDECEKQGFETEFISLAGKKTGYCVACDVCTKPPHECYQEDDVKGMLEAMVSSDALIIGSPTYFGSVSGQLKALFDRTLPLRRNDFRLSGKLGGAIAVGGSRNGGQEHVCSQIHNWMLIQNMLVVSDKKTSHFGGIGVGRTQGGILEDRVGVDTARNLAAMICQMLKKR